MADPVSIPCVLMRGGTSRAAFFLRSDLPAEPGPRDAVLIAAMGAGHELQVDGIGGGNPVTSKVAIVGPSSRPGADVDYLFAQVGIRERSVDLSPICGNILAAVGPFAIEAGLVPAGDGTTTVRVHNVNTGKIVEAEVATPGRRVTYEGETAIAGVPGTGAAIHLAFLDAAGAKTGVLLPTGRPVDLIDGIPVSCVDAATPVVLVRAADLGKSGREPAAHYLADTAFMTRLERLRVAAGRAMGFPDAAERVIPKPVLLAAAAEGGALCARYFTPHECHKALAIGGAVAVATAVATPGTIAAALAGPARPPTTVDIEHPSGRLPVRLATRPGDGVPVAGVVRTARRLFEGRVLVRHADLVTARAAA